LGLIILANNKSENYILRARSKQFYWEGDGQLSIKTFANGKAYYKTPDGFFAVGEHRHLILNEGPYTIMIDEETEVESFCVFFDNGLAGEVLRTFRDSAGSLLSDPFKQNKSVDFFEKTHQTTARLSSIFNRLQNDRAAEEEDYHFLMQELLHGHIQQLSAAHTLASIRTSTREELYKRISIAHDYIRACFHEQITLSDISKTACLSPNHLLRNYSQIYGKTPHQHLTAFRVMEAKRLLAGSELNMTDITFRIGLQNPVSFSKLFKQQTGFSPLHYRKKVRMDKNKQT
jgi:AraC family transcriptional regulator